MASPVAVQACFPPVLKARVNHGVGNINMISSSQLLKRRSVIMVTNPSRTIPTPQVLLMNRGRRLITTAAASNSKGGNGMDMAVGKKISPVLSSSSYGDPCLDFFFNVERPDSLYDRCADERKQKAFLQHAETHEYMEHLLPLAWSHNPLTTLKLIFKLRSFSASDNRRPYFEAFDAAVFWLFRNHPKTLARNVDSFQNMYNLIDIVYQLLVDEEKGQQSQDGIEISISSSDFAKRYDRDPDFKLLHDRVVDDLVERLKSDIAKIKQNKVQLKPSDFNEDGDDESDSDDEFDSDDESLKLAPAAHDDLYVTVAAEVFLTQHPSVAPMIGCLSLLESAGRILFPQESDRSEEWERLRKEFLVPLTNYHNRQGEFNTRRRCEAYHYLKELKENAAAIKPDALLPHQIVRYLEHGDLLEAAELQWKAMVEDMSMTSSKFKSSLAVCDVKHEMFEVNKKCAAVLALLVSQLSEEPWKGKVITHDQLISIQGGDDIKSKYSFLSRMKSPTSFMDIENVFELILQVAVNANLKAEQMINKLFFFTNHATSYACVWEAKYGAIRSKFEENGYAMPHVLFWGISSSGVLWMPPTQLAGATMMNGGSDNLVKSFLDNGGQIGPHHLLEVAISDKDLQTLTVVD